MTETLFTLLVVFFGIVFAAIAIYACGYLQGKKDMKKDLKDCIIDRLTIDNVEVVRLAINKAHKRGDLLLAERDKLVDKIIMVARKNDAS